MNQSDIIAKKNTYFLMQVISWTMVSLNQHHHHQSIKKRVIWFDTFLDLSDFNFSTEWKVITRPKRENDKKNVNFNPVRYVKKNNAVYIKMSFAYRHMVYIFPFFFAFLRSEIRYIVNSRWFRRNFFPFSFFFFFILTFLLCH